MLVNHFSEKIGKGETKSVLLSGCEDLATFTRAMKQGYGVTNATGGHAIVNATGEKTVVEAKKYLPWGDDPGGVPTGSGSNGSGSNGSGSDGSGSSDSAVLAVVRSKQYRVICSVYMPLLQY